MVDEFIFESKEEYLYLKMSVAKEEHSVTENVEVKNILLDIIKNTREEYDLIESKEYLESVDQIIISENDKDLYLMKKAKKKLVAFYLLLMVTIVATISGCVYANWLYRKKNENRITTIQAEFEQEIAQALLECKDEYEYKEYHISEISYQLVDIQLVDSYSGVIYVDFYAYYDAIKYDKYGYGDSMVGYLLYDIGSSHKIESSTGWELELKGKCYVNGYKENEFNEYKYNDDILYKDFNYSWVIVLVGLLGIIVLAVFIYKTQKGLIESKYRFNQKAQMYKIKKGKKKIIIGLISTFVAIVVLLIAIWLGIEVYKGKTLAYTSAEELLFSRDYSAALEEYEKAKGYKDSKDKIVFLQNILSSDYDEAILIGSQMEGDYSDILAELELQKKESIYQQAQVYIQNKDFKNAKINLAEINGYKNANQLYSQMDNYEKYYEALEYETESMVGAMEIYKTLPLDFMDVSTRISKYERYLDCLGEYGNSNGYITDGIKIKDFEVKADGIYLVSSNLPTMKMETSDISGYIGYLYWDKYDRKWYISKNKVLFFEGNTEKTFLP